MEKRPIFGQKGIKFKMKNLAEKSFFVIKKNEMESLIRIASWYLFHFLFEIFEEWEIF
jgi:hypothetical protein